MTASHPRLLDVFTDDVLELIAEKMGRRERLAFTSTCRRLRALRDTSARLWSRLRVSGDKPTHSQLPVFLARGPKRVRELVLGADVEVNGMFPEQVEEGAVPVFDPAVIQSMLISASLVGSRLETLVLLWPGELEVGGWVALMPNLRRLGLFSYDEAGHQKLIVTSALAALLRLETFCFDAIELEMEDSCLPASLRTLCLMWQHYQPLPTAVTHATQLRSLALREWWGGDLRCIERLSQLTYLGLSATAGDHDDPPPALRLSAFPQLQCLVLGGRDRPYPLSLEAASSAVQQLTYLNLRHVTPGNQPDLCAGLSILTNLQLIDTEWASPSILTPAALAGMRQLRAASLHVQTAVTAAAVLQALPRLEFLFLHLRFYNGAHAGNRQVAKPAPADVAALLNQLAISPAMRGLHMDEPVTRLLYDENQQQLFQPALAKLAAAGIKVHRAPAWWGKEQPWQAAAGIPAEPDSDLCSLLRC